MNARSLLLAGFASLISPLTAGAASAPGINPTADTFVSSANPTDNYGAAGALEVSAPAAAKGEFDTFVRFNLASTESYFNGVYGANNWTVQSITLQFTTSATNNALFNASAAGMFSIQLNSSDAWAEGTGTPAAPDTTSTDLNYNNHTNYESSADPVLGMYAFAGGTSGANTYPLGLTSGLLSDVQNGTDASLYVSAADTSVSYLFNSTNFTTANARPLLVVTAVPEPDAGVLLAAMAGVLGLGTAFRRRRHA